jgi:uncharacterized protein
LKYYLDTSFAVSAFTPELETARAQCWLEKREPGQIQMSDWVLTEFSSALSMKIRTNALTIAQRRLVDSDWRLFCDTGLSLIPISSQDFSAAAHMAAQHDLSLRASDALHLAIAQSSGSILVTLDRRMSIAAIQLGLPVEDF